MLRLRALWVLLVALPFALPLGVPQLAGAGTFTELTCSPTTGAGNWQPVDTFPSGLTVGNMCGGLASGPNEPEGPTDEGALFAEDGPNITATIPNGAEAGWLFTAPAGLTITGLSYWRSLHAYDQQSLVPGLWTGEGTTLEACQSPPYGTHECNSLNNQGLITFTNLDTSSLFFGVRCNLVGGDEYCGSSGGMNHFAQADLYSANVTLSEAASPNISSVGGAPWSGAVLSGQVPLTLSASDYSGVASVTIRSSDGVLLGSESEACDYYDPVPCPELSAVAINLNTTQAPDGPQNLILTVRDAAGDTSTETSLPVLIDNNGPASPMDLGATVSGSLTVPSPVVEPPGKTVKKLQAVIESSGHLSVSGPVPKGVSGRVRVCWRSMRAKRVLGSRCATLHVEHGAIAVIFHTSARARRGKITVTLSRGRRLFARLTARLHTT
jgi:hypothetical protein